MIQESLADWNYWWKEEGVEESLLGKDRDALSNFSSYLEFREIKILVGIRRSGKSTLLYQFINNLLHDGVKPREIVLINFEDDIFAKLSLEEVFNAYQSNINPDTKPYLFLDEIHRCGKWVQFLRKLYDLKKVKQVFITDSSSKFIQPEYSRVLTGRTLTLSVFTLSFREYLHWKNINYLSPQDSGKINLIKNVLNEFLEYGGFPEIFFKAPAAKKKLLTEYFGDIITKDIIERYNISYVKLKPLADYLVSNSASAFSPRKYSRTNGLSLESINVYLGYFKEVSLFFFVPKFDYSIQSQQLSSKKVYCGDLGFFTNVGFRFTENKGRIYENAVFLELKRRGKEVYYWNAKHECDFLIKEGLKITAVIQVCFNVNPENEEREIAGLLEAMQEFKLNEGIIITEDLEAEKQSDGKNIKFIPLWRWLLEE